MWHVSSELYGIISQVWKGVNKLIQIPQVDLKLNKSTQMDFHKNPLSCFNTEERAKRCRSTFKCCESKPITQIVMTKLIHRFASAKVDEMKKLISRIRHCLMTTNDG